VNAPEPTTRKRILELLGRRPLIRETQISDALDIEPRIVTAELEGAMRNGDIQSEEIDGPQGNKTTGYRIKAGTLNWKRSEFNATQQEEKSMSPRQELAYDPNNLLDTLIDKLDLKNDAALSRALEVAPPLISKIRHGRLPIGASMLIRMHEVSDLSIRDLRYLMGDRRNKFRISDKQFKPKEGETPQNNNNSGNNS
jgi:hypothetical protein